MNQVFQITFLAIIVSLCQSQKVPLKKTNFFYTGQISLGTPAKNFQVLFDTISTDFMMLSNKNDVPIKGDVYSSSSSSSYSNFGDSVEIDYSFEYIFGDLSKDTLQIGGLSVSNQVFAETTSAGSYFYSPPFSGVLGLAPIPKENSNGYNLPIANLLSSGQISDNMFSIWYNKNDSSSNEGELFLGGTNPTLYTGSLKYISLNSATSWTLKASSLSINGLNFAAQFSVLVSTEHGIIYGDESTIGKINTKIGSLYDFDSGVYYIKAAKLSIMPTIVINFSGNAFPLKPEDYTYNCKFTCNFGSCDNFCLIGFNTVPKKNSPWIFGNLFLKTYYAAFDIKNLKIGFAPAVQMA